MKATLDTIIIFVKDVDRLKKFYIDVFQMTLIEEYPLEWVLLQSGTGKLGLHKIGKQYQDENDDNIKWHSNTKIVFDIEENIAEVRSRLLLQNIPMREVKTFEGYAYWLCDGEDPEGNMFQLKQALPVRR